MSQRRPAISNSAGENRDTASKLPRPGMPRRSAANRKRPPVSDEPVLGLLWGEVHLAEHDPHWTSLYEQERDCLLKALGPAALDIQHVGSTAVPRLTAKPIIDIAVAITHLTQAKDAEPALRDLDYEFMPDIKIPGELFYRKLTGTHHLHILEFGSDHWQNYIRFRDYLRENPHVASDYIELKRALADRFSHDRPSYTRGKAQFIESILRKARE